MVLTLMLESLQSQHSLVPYYFFGDKIDESGATRLIELDSDALKKKLVTWTDARGLGSTGNERRSRLMINLKNDHLKGTNNCPYIPVECFALMLNYDTKRTNNDGYDGSDALEVSVAQREDAPIPGANGELCSSVSCHKFKKDGSLRQ